MSLPNPPRRAALRAFWLTSVCLFGLPAAAVMSALAGISPVVIVLVWVGILCFGVIMPQHVAVVYGVWLRLSSRALRLSNLAMTAVCFYLVFPVVGAAGTRLPLKRAAAGESLWEAADTRAGGTADEADATAGSGGGWVFRYLNRAVESGNLWTICLLPFLVMLRFNDQQKNFYPSQIYTLF